MNDDITVSRENVRKSNTCNYNTRARLRESVAMLDMILMDLGAVPAPSAAPLSRPDFAPAQ